MAETGGKARIYGSQIHPKPEQVTSYASIPGIYHKRLEHPVIGVSQPASIAEDYTFRKL